MTTNFFVPPSEIRTSRVVLPEDEARHVHSVLRADEGDEITVVDGEGGWYRVRIQHCDPTQVVGTIQKTRSEVGEPAVNLTVGLGIIAKRSRFETFIEKAVELGVRRIIPLLTRRTERQSIREERLRKVMVAALKQCRRSRLPRLTPPSSLDDVLESSTAESRLLCHGGKDVPPMLRTLGSSGATGDVSVLVGPEGGFAPGEVETATEAGFTPVSLGPRRLRAETAGIAAINAVTLHDEASARGG